MEKIKIGYSKYFRSLIMGRQQEYLVYREIYKVSEQFFNSTVKLNVYDQIADIDGIDFIIRCETQSQIMYFEGQVKKTRGSLQYDRLRERVEKSILSGSEFLVFSVDYSGGSDLPKIYYHTGVELINWYADTSSKRVNLGKLNKVLQRNTAIETFGEFIKSRIPTNDSSKEKPD